MRNALNVSTARTAIGTAYRGSFNATPPTQLAAHAIKNAMPRRSVDPAEIDNWRLCRALPQGFVRTTGCTGALRAGLPVTVSGITLDREYTSGLIAMATASKRVSLGGMALAGAKPDEMCIGGGMGAIEPSEVL